MKRFLLAFIIIACAAKGAAAQEIVKLSLADAMEYAMKHNYTVKNAQLDILIQKAQVAEQISAAYPHISGKGEFDDYVNTPKTFIPSAFFSPGAEGFTPVTFIPKYAASATVNANQVLFDGSVLVAVQARNTVIEFARQNSEVTIEGIRYNVTRAYNSLVIAYRQFDIIKSSLAFARSLEHDLTETQKAGFAEKIDVERTSVQVNNLSSDSIRIGNVLSISEQVLKFQLGMNINTPIVLTDTNLDTRRERINELLVAEKAYERVPEYNLFTTQLKLNEYNLRRYQLSAIPTLSTFANAGYNYSPNYFKDLFVNRNYIGSFLVGLQLNIPIFNGLIRLNQVREANLNVEKAKNNIDNIKLTIDFQEAQSRTSLRNALLQAQSQRRNVELSSDVLDLAQRKYKAGVGSNLEVTTAQTDQLRAETNYFNALLDLINAEADLKKALGLLK